MQGHARREATVVISRWTANSAKLHEIMAHPLTLRHGPAGWSLVFI